MEGRGREKLPVIWLLRVGNMCDGYFTGNNTHAGKEQEKEPSSDENFLANLLFYAKL